VVFALSVGGAFTFQIGNKIRAVEPPPEWTTEARRSDGDVIVVEPEADLVARLNAELIAKFLRDDDLSFRPNSMCHTGEYNRVPAKAKLGAARLLTVDLVS
jgi:hypothetical protein